MQATVATPFGVTRKETFPLGWSVDAMSRRLFGTVDGIVAFIRCPEGSRQKWEVIPRDFWRFIKPKGVDCIKFEIVPSGGDSGNVFGLVAAVLVTVAAPYLAAGLGSILGTSALAVGTLGNALVAGGIAIGGSFLTSQLFPAQTTGLAQAKPQQAASAFQNVDTDANVLGTDAAPPKAIGTVRLTPPDMTQPHRYLENGKEFVERVFGLTGKHTISDIKIGDADIDDLPGVTYQVRDGDEATAAQSLVRRVAKTTPVGQELKKFIFESDSNKIADQVTPSNSEPAAVIYAPGYFEGIKQYTFRLTLDPFIYTGSATADVRLPIRIRFRQRGTSTWYKVPEIHIYGRNINRRPKEIRVRWDNEFHTALADSEYEYDFYREVPATSSTLSDGSSGTQWEAHSSFATGSGYRDVTYISGTVDAINIRLDSDTFPVGDYEFEFVQGMPVRDSLFTNSTYALSGSVESLFRAKDSSGFWVIPIDADGVSAGATIEWMTYVVNRRPVEKPGIAQIAMQVSDTDARNITCLAKAWVYDYGANGSPADWSTKAVTDNPASHYYTVLKEWLEFFNVSTSLIATSEFSAWHTECETQGYKVSYLAAGQPVSEVLDQIATAGFATKRFGFGYGIDFFRDRTSEAVEMTFSNRDSRISFRKVFSDNPKGYRVKYRNEDDNYSDDEIFINEPYGATTIPENQSMEYGSIADPDLVRKRAHFDMLQNAYRKRIWSIDTGPAGFNRATGDLVGIVTDLETDFAHGFFVRQVLNSTTIAVDRTVPGDDSSDMLSIADMLAEEDLLTVGNTATAHILMPTGVEEYTIESVSENVIVLGSALSSTDIEGTRLTVSAREALFHRAFVLRVSRQSDQRAILTCVDEAPQIITELAKVA